MSVEEEAIQKTLELDTEKIRRWGLLFGPRRRLPASHPSKIPDPTARLTGGDRLDTRPNSSPTLLAKFAWRTSTKSRPPLRQVRNPDGDTLYVGERDEHLEGRERGVVDGV